MNKYMAFDLGGSAVKYGIINENGEILEQGSFKTITDDFLSLRDEMFKVFYKYKESNVIYGVALSLPGSVDTKSGIIGGLSAVPCIHGPNIYESFKEFGVKVSIENDANCAALCETWIGATKDVDDSIFIIIGSGIGGAVVKNKKVHVGKHQHGGEFGYMIADEQGGIMQSYSDLASTHGLINEIYFRTGEVKNGKEIFKESEKYKHFLNKFYYYNAKLIYNLQYAYDPERIVLGGGVSGNPKLLEGIKKQINYIIENGSEGTIIPDVVLAEYSNNANLIGAVYHHITS